MTDDEELPVQNKLRSLGKEWIIVETFEDPKMAKEKMASLTYFSYQYKHITQCGLKRYFHCNKRKQCPAEYQLFYGSNTTIILKSSEHDHAIDASDLNVGVKGIPKATKSQIEKLREMKLKPKAIISTLRNNHPG